MHPTPLFAAANVGLLAGHPCSNLDAQSDPDRDVRSSALAGQGQ
jgi:hypothetical protein